LGRRQRGTIGERWDPRKLRRIREDGWFRQHEADLIAAARRRRTAGPESAARPAGGSNLSPPATSEYDDALRRATAIVARAMDLIRDVDHTSPPGSK
jgi:hypothetical protein